MLSLLRKKFAAWRCLFLSRRFFRRHGRLADPIIYDEADDA